MAVNEVTLNGEELINLTEDTVSEDTLLEGAIAHDASGNQITGKVAVAPLSDDTPQAAGTASAGSAETVSRSDHVHPAQTTVSGNAGSATKLATARTIDGVSFNGSAAIGHYGTCSTAAATAAKTVALTGFTLVTGAWIAVRFTVTNTASSPTLNVNSTGAIAIQYRNAAITVGYLAAGRTYLFVYDGSSYELVGDINVNTNTLNTAGSTNTSSKIFLIGATSQAANPVTYSHDTCYIGTDGCLYSNGEKCLTSGEGFEVMTGSIAKNMSSTTTVTLGAKPKYVMIPNYTSTVYFQDSAKGNITITDTGFIAPIISVASYYVAFV